MKNIELQSFQLWLVLAGLIVAGGNVCAQEMYAVLEVNTLSLFYDGSRESREGKVFSVTDGHQIVLDRDNDLRQVEEFVFDASFATARPVSTAYWFSELKNLKSVQAIENLNTSEVTDMSGMFYMCCRLPNLDVIHFDIGNVKRMISMFKFPPSASFMMWSRAPCSMSLKEPSRCMLLLVDGMNSQTSKS